MPGYDGSGPAGSGEKPGRWRGGCGERPSAGRGRGMGRGHGPGRGLGWLTMGYGPGGAATAAVTVKTALTERRAFLLAELARTEALLAGEGQAVSGQAGKDGGR